MELKAYNLTFLGKTEKERVEMFYRLWTLKESFIKATGTGMSLPLNEFNIIIDNNIISVEQTSDTRNFCFGEESPCAGYYAAWCFEER